MNIYLKWTIAILVPLLVVAAVVTGVWFWAMSSEKKKKTTNTPELKKKKKKTANTPALTRSDVMSYEGSDGISFIDDKGNKIIYVAGMTKSERNLTFMKVTVSNYIYFPYSRTYDYVLLSTSDDPNKFQFIVRSRNKLYLTNSIPNLLTDIDTSRPIRFNSNTNNFEFKGIDGNYKILIEKSKLRLKSGIGRNAITNTNMDRNSINSDLEQVFNYTKNPETNLFDNPEKRKLNNNYANHSMLVAQLTSRRQLLV